ncbi:MAG: serine hydroxymethyltransferase [Gammaproteobacteria bacterium]|jgi:glycine hydroxymethyltransferase|nr:serine hydroxymethyltransferase [Gammaproteobacteria bacterium]MDH3971236.1 serine hydroxymethyltransferase [Gammaproteobacteria bacterium]MDH3985842.1 serine hydroxymethyltransferase [Gammaproteobacteria bacterium]
MFDKDMRIEGYDEELSAAMQGERQRQEDHIELIASENYASPRVLEAQGSVLTNKYAEGYPGKRYYGGCEYVDVAEQLAIDRTKALFNADYANVQPHSGSQANAAVYLALLQPGDTILGMSLDAGGHLTHGSKVNFSGKLFNAVQYGLDTETGAIDYDQVEALAKEHRPKMVVAGFSAYSLHVDWQRFRDIADSIGAYLLVDMAHVSGLVAAGIYPSPVNIADITTTTTHKTLRGPRGGLIMARANEAIEKKLNSMIFPGTQGGPLMHVIAAKAVALKEAMEPGFKVYQQQVLDNARVMVEVMLSRGYNIVSGRTDDHLFLVDLIDKGITGKQADAALDAANITVNKNAVPNDPQSPFVTSGIRIGTPAITTRGCGEQEVRELAGWMCDVMDDVDNQDTIAAVRDKVLELCQRFPVYRDS